MRKLFWEDAYISEFKAVVQSVEGRTVYLDATAFNPRGGGLVGDTGAIGNCRVADTVKEGEEKIAHLLETDPPFHTGDEVTGKIDWERRYRIMKMHTTAHALSAVIGRRTGALITGNQIRPDESRIDFSLDRMDRAEIEQFIDEVNSAIKRALPVRSYFLPKDEAMKIEGIVKLANASPPDLREFRIVEIEGLDIQADGGVHVKNMQEIGSVELVKLENKGKNNRRLYFTVG